MDMGKANIVGVYSSRVYTGHHRANEMPNGIGMIPMGDRSRDRTEYGVAIFEERDSVDVSTSRKR